MRAVRRIPHHGRSVANPRTRRAANMQYQTPGSTLMVLSPGDRDREAMDPIAELLSQLSSVRSRAAAAQSVSSQLQQLEMQLHSSRPSATSRLQTDRPIAGQPTSVGGIIDPLGRSVTTISFPSSSAATEQQTATSVSPGNSSVSGRDRSSFVLARLSDAKKSESEQQAIETERADKSMFVQELLLALLATGNDPQKSDYKTLLAPLPTATVAEQQTPEPQPSEPAAAPTSGFTTDVENREQPQQQVVTESNVPVEHPLATAAISHVGRPNLHAPPSDGRILSHSATSFGSRAVTKRKAVPTTNTTKVGKEATSVASAAAQKRH